MKLTTKLLVLLLLGLFAVSAMAKADKVTVPKGTEVILVFDQNMSSKTAKVGDSVALHVQDSVKVDNKTVIAAGTKVTATISSVDKKKRYGVNAKIRMVLNPVKSTYDKMITLDPRSQGKYVKGKKSEQAAGATVGGAMILGPVGLVGGYFVSGKSVTIHSGDRLATEVSQTVTLTRK